MYDVKEEWYLPGSGRFCADWLRSVRADAWLAVLSGLQRWWGALATFPSSSGASHFSTGGGEEGRGGGEADAFWISACDFKNFFLSLGESGLEVTFFPPLQRIGLMSGDWEQLMLLLGEEMGSDSLEHPAFFLHLFPFLLCCSPGVTEGRLHWKDMGSKSKLEIPAAGGQRSRSSSGCGGKIHVWTRSAPLWLSFSGWVLWSSLLLVLRRSSPQTTEMAPLVDRGLRGQYVGGSPGMKINTLT